MQARGYLDNRLKYCCLKVIYCIYQANELKREITKKLGGQAKIWEGHGPPRPPLRIVAVTIDRKEPFHSQESDTTVLSKYIFCLLARHHHLCAAREVLYVIELSKTRKH